METIGDAYMIVGGVPTPTNKHALLVAEMAFSMLRALKTLRDPSDRTGKSHLRLRIGVQSFSVHAVGIYFLGWIKAGTPPRLNIEM